MSKPIFDPQKSQPRWRQKCKIWLKMSIFTEPWTIESILGCTDVSSKIINSHWTPIIDIHGVNACFIHHPSNVKNYSIGHKFETGQPNSGEHFFTPFCQFMAQNSKYKWPKVFIELFFTSGKSALSGPPNGPVVRYSKIQNRLSRAS